MRDIVTPTEAFLRRATVDGYSMQTPFIHPLIGKEISGELKRTGYLVDYTELKPTTIFKEKGMRVARLVHETLNEMLCSIEGKDENHIPLFSVRVFEPGQHDTTIHRNHPSVGPWAIGITLSGAAPFNVYRQDQLTGYEQTIPLIGDGTDPVPRDSMNACAGSGWALYTKKRTHTP